MNNEPVAWIKQGRLGYPVLEFDKPFRYESYAIQNSPIPLYTHPINPKYDPETGEPLIDGYPLFSGLPHPVKEHFEDEPQAEELHEILQSNSNPVKEQLSNGHLSDCAIHNEPALRNQPCDCGFEPKFNLSDLKHEDNCRYFDDGLFCTCGAEDSALVEWYRHKQVIGLCGGGGYNQDAANMLRQQQDEITVLKQILSYEGIEVNLDECVEEFRKAQEK